MNPVPRTLLSRRSALAGLGALSGAALLTACGGSSGSGRTTISYLSWQTEEDARPLIEAFEAAHPDIKIDFSYSAPTAGYFQTLQTRIAGNQQPTVHCINPETKEKLIGEKLVADLTDEPFMASLTPDEQPLADLGWFPFPSVEGGKGDPTAIMGGVDGYSCAADVPAVCADFLNFIMTEENQEGYAAFDMLPTNRDAQDAVTAEPLIAAMEAGNSAAYSQVWLDTSLGANVGNALNVAVVDLLAGKSDAQGVVDAMTAAAAKE